MKTLTDYKVDVPEGVSGDWGIIRFEASSNLLQSARLAREGRYYVPGCYTRLYHRGELNAVMTDTPDEVRDHLPVIRRVTGRVLINGLGIGMVLRAALENPEVTHVDVVEIEEDVLKLVAPSYTDSRITYHHANAFDIRWPVGTRWNVVWHDIWESLYTDNLSEMTQLKRRYGRRCDWQGCWGEDYTRRLQRRGW